MYLCVIDAEGGVRVHKNIRTDPTAFSGRCRPSVRMWWSASRVCSPGTWLVDLCGDEGMPFVLRHALSMRAMHGSNAQHDRLDAHTITAPLRRGLLPHAYV
jgi:hypothetical protein